MQRLFKLLLVGLCFMSIVACGESENNTDKNGKTDANPVGDANLEPWKAEGIKVMGDFTAMLNDITKRLKAGEADAQQSFNEATEEAMNSWGRKNGDKLNDAKEEDHPKLFAARKAMEAAMEAYKEAGGQ